MEQHAANADDQVTAGDVVEVVRRNHEALLPRLEKLPADRRAALGEDLRQLVG